MTRKSCRRWKWPCEVLIHESDQVSSTTSVMPLTSKVDRVSPTRNQTSQRTSTGPTKLWRKKQQTMFLHLYSSDSCCAHANLRHPPTGDLILQCTQIWAVSSRCGALLVVLSVKRRVRDWLRRYPSATDSNKFVLLTSWTSRIHWTEQKTITVSHVVCLGTHCHQGERQTCHDVTLRRCGILPLVCDLETPWHVVTERYGAPPRLPRPKPSWTSSSTSLLPNPTEGSGVWALHQDKEFLGDT